MNSYDTIHGVVASLLEKAGLPQVFVVNRPDEITHGDYATNVAFVLAKRDGVSPKVCADGLVAGLQEELKDVVEKIEVAGPGFINFFVKDDIVRTENKREDIPLQTIYNGKKVIVEHSSPNLFKPFSIGHFMNNMTGEFIVRGMIRGGAEVTTLSFPSDISLGVAKAIYQIQKDGGLDNPIFKNSEEEIVKFLGSEYVVATSYFKENPGEEIIAKEITDKLYSKENSPEKILYEKTKDINISYFTHLLQGLGSHIDGFIYESEAGEVGKKIVEQHTPSVFTKSEGAVVYIPDESRKDINTSVFINSQGNPTYDAKDIGLLDIKFDRYNPDYSFFVTDHEQIPHFKVVLDAAMKINKEWNEKSIHVPHGRMLFKGEKMSSRLGGVPLLIDVVATVEEEVRARSGDKIAHLSEDEKKELEREIALSALRISVLRSKPGININFDPEVSLSFDGDSGPYLLYTHARCASLLEKGSTQGVEPMFKDYIPNVLERRLISFEQILTESIEEIAPQKLVAYLFLTAQLFNGFYAEVQIISDDKEKTAHNLAIVKRVKAVLKEGLYILGIEAPERM